ncbi:MAG TPA: NnrS family protein [Burkholderiaceae bacterium]|nr:NnrS family protein [Burkholderiaceae bacterium]
MMSRFCPACAVDHPLWVCAFRPFFLFAAITAPLLIGAWGLVLAFGLPLPSLSGGPAVWHAHELLFGFGIAGVAGFTLISLPEFAGAADLRPSVVRVLAGLWLAGRIAFWLSGPLGSAGLVLSALAHLALLIGMIALLAPDMWRQPERPHLAFFWIFVALIVVVAGFYVDALRGVDPARWLHACLGIFMALIVVAMSRISWYVVNRHIDKLAITGVEYRARPPRRNLAVFCISAYTVAEFFMPQAAIGGWLALAAAAALLNLLNDWHIGRALFQRWPFMLYSVYVFMALGYGVMGLALLTDGGAVSAGRHLLTIGAFGLNIYVVMSIAGRMHCGYTFDDRPWVPAGALLLALAALLRAGVAWPGAPARLLLALAAVCWVVAFLLCVRYFWPLFTRPRFDGAGGCAGVQPTPDTQ